LKKILIFLGIAVALGAGIYFLVKKKGSSYGSPSESGIGIGGVGRAGYPKTNVERSATHKAKYGISELPTRGTGLTR